MYNELVSATLNPGISGRTYSVWNDYGCIACNDLNQYGLSESDYSPYRSTGKSDNDVSSQTVHINGLLSGMLGIV